MALERREIQYTSLDFDDIKEALINHIKQDKTFNGANFQGAGLNLISDLLAYVTHMTSVTANISANEMFMDSAQLRQSIVSKAKELGYCPISLRTPYATLRLTFGDTNKNREKVFIPAGTRFATKSNSVFSTKEDYIALPIEPIHEVRKGKNGKEYIYDEYRFQADISVYEGYYNEFVYTVEIENEDQRFYVPSPKADISTLSVLVQPYNTSDLEIYTENDNLNLLTPESKVYFLHQNPDSIYELTFGDGVLGKKLTSGDKIILRYIISDAGKSMNGCSYFEKATPIDGFSSYTIEVLEPARDGYDQESGEQIRFRASKMWKAQNRAVIKEDYKSILLSEYPWIDAVSVWGGQYNDPPTYGKVFFAIKPKHTDLLALNLKEHIKEDLIKKYNVITVIPEIVDPDYLYIGVNTAVSFKQYATTRSAHDISEDIQNRIIDYFKQTTEDFDLNLYLSPLTTVIDSTDKSIASSTTTTYISKRIYPKPYEERFFTEAFSNALVPGSFFSSQFNDGLDAVYVKSYLKDDGKGKIHVYAVNSDTGVPLIEDVGTINYITGEVVIRFTTYALPDSGVVCLYATTVNEDIESFGKQIIMKDKNLANDFWNILQGTSVRMNDIGFVKK